MLKKKLMLGIIFISLSSLQGCFVKDLISSIGYIDIYVNYGDDSSADEEDINVPPPVIINDPPPVVDDPPPVVDDPVPPPKIKIRKSSGSVKSRSGKNTSLRNSSGRHSNSNSTSTSTRRSLDRHERKHRR